MEDTRPTRLFILKFKGIDDFNRPVYKDVNSNIYFGSTQALFPDKNLAPHNTPKEINNYFRDNLNQLEYFGVKFNCEPEGGLASNWKFKIID